MKKQNFILNALFLLLAIPFYSQNVMSNSNITSGGLQAGSSGNNNTFYGFKAGQNITSGKENVVIGHNTNTTNSAIGAVAIGYGANVIGGHAVSIGHSATTSGGISIGTQASSFDSSISIGHTTGGGLNTISIGHYSGGDLGANSDNNIFIGKSSGADRNTSKNNIFIGNNSGYLSQGNNAIIIGNNIGVDQNIDNKLVIGTSLNSYPLIWGDFMSNHVKLNGKVGIGYGFGSFPINAGNINVNNYSLFVKGGILTQEIRVMLESDWADYVFKSDYNLMPIDDLLEFIDKNKHLPNVPSAEKISFDGIELGEITKIQQEKIEELTLYIIQQHKINNQQNKEIKELKEKVEKLIDNQER